MTEQDPSDAHWLLRLDADQWIDAATKELLLAQPADAARRRVITHLRRAAGMALNGALVARHRALDAPLEEVCRVWGRSYMDHLRAIATDAPLLGLTETARADAHTLVSLQFQASAAGLVSLRTTDAREREHAGDAARALVKACADQVRHGRDA